MFDWGQDTDQMIFKIGVTEENKAFVPSFPNISVGVLVYVARENVTKPFLVIH